MQQCCKNKACGEIKKLILAIALHKDGKHITNPEAIAMSKMKRIAEKYGIQALTMDSDIIEMLMFYDEI